MTDDEIIAIRDQHLPAQGESFDCVAFARAVERRVSMGMFSADDMRELLDAADERDRLAAERAGFYSQYRFEIDEKAKLRIANAEAERDRLAAALRTLGYGRVVDDVLSGVEKT